MFVSMVHIDSLSVEATARKAPNGDLFVVCTCGGTREPAPENAIRFFRSKDGGRTWEDARTISPEDGRAHYQSCTFVEDGKIYVCALGHNGAFVEWRNYLLVSEDSGYTWTERETPLLKENAMIRDAVRLSDGKLLLPYHSYPVTREQEEDCRRRGVILCESKIPFVEIGVLLGDLEHGFETVTAFRETRLPLWGNGKWQWSWTENTVAELETGHLVMLYRHDLSDRLWRTDSFDHGRTWQTPHKTDIPNPNNKPQLLKGPKGEIVLLNTPNDRPGPYLKRRFPLEAWVSYDNMTTWGKKLRVSDFPGAYSYADGFIDDDGHLKLAFEFNRHDVYFADMGL